MDCRARLAQGVQRGSRCVGGEHAHAREPPPSSFAPTHRERNSLVSKTNAAVAPMVDARRALTRLDVLLCAMPISLFLSIVSLI